MSVAIKATQLAGRWVHSHEESDDQRIVFRSPEYDFPPARGRQALTFEPGGGLVVEHPGPTDRGETARGTWTAKKKVLTIDGLGWSGDYEVESVDAHQLVLRRKD